MVTVFPDPKGLNPAEPLGLDSPHCDKIIKDQVLADFYRILLIFCKYFPLYDFVSVLAVNHCLVSKSFAAVGTLQIPSGVVFLNAIFITFQKMARLVFVVVAK